MTVKVTESEIARLRELLAEERLCFNLMNLSQGRIPESVLDNWIAASCRLSRAIPDALPALLDAAAHADPLRKALEEADVALNQYRNDMLYPPAPDSRERRIAMIDAVIARSRK